MGIVLVELLQAECPSCHPTKGMEALKRLSFYPRDAMLVRVFATATCLSVRLSVTRRYCA